MILTRFMNKTLMIAGTLTGALMVSSCDTPVGKGAGWGAVGGAILGGMAGGNVRSAAIGSAAGAGLGALIGAAVEDRRRAEYEREAPPGGYPVGSHTEYHGIVQSPYPPHHYIDVHGIPSGALVMDPSVGRPFVRP